MKKKTILILAILSLVALPLAAQAATEFTLGGFVKLETVWDSTMVNTPLTQWIVRNNTPSGNFTNTGHHGRFKMTAEGSRFNFTIKGPQVWGAQITGFFEMDFDNGSAINVDGGTGGTGLNFSPHQARLRLRHAMFRLNWPETELLMGQFWSMMSEEIPDCVHAGAFEQYGSFSLRTPQIRLTQKFLGAWTASIAITEPDNGTWGLITDPNNRFEGETTETPRVEGRIKYEADLWGKAAFYGVPRGFSVRLAAFWERSRHRAANFGASWRTWGQDNFVNVAGVNTAQRDQQYLDHWCVQGSMFIPILPTYSQNLAGTMSLLTQWYIGRGLAGVKADAPINDRFWRYTGFGTGAAGDPFQFDIDLVKRYGGFVQLQYYFNNEWYMNFVWGFNKAFGVENSTNTVAGLNNQNFLTMNAFNAATGDPLKMNMMFDITLWYRPIQALKFGLSYVYARSEYMQRTTTASWITDTGENHRVQFAGFYFF
jgi:hypothetical protein